MIKIWRPDVFGLCAARCPARWCVPLRVLLAVLAIQLVLASSACASQAAPAGPTVADVVSFTRIVLPATRDLDALRNQVSPRGDLAFLVTRQADIAADTNRYRIQLFDARPERLAAAVGGQSPKPTLLLELNAADDYDSAYPALQQMQWANDHTLVFRWRPKGKLFQVHALDVRTGWLRQLTQSPNGTVHFAVSADLGRVVYVAPHPNPARKPGQPAVVVGNQSFWSVKFGQEDTRAQQRRYQYFFADAAAPDRPRPLGDHFAEASLFPPVANISPDGRWALVHQYEYQRHSAWARMYPLVAEVAERFGASQSIDPLAYFSRPGSFVARKLVAYRLPDARQQQVLDAPDDAWIGPAQGRPDKIWQSDSRSVVLAGQHLPPDAQRRSSDPVASHLVEFWPDSGRWQVITALRGRLEAIHRPEGRNVVVLVDAKGRRAFARGADGAWQAEEEPLGTEAATGWTLRIAEDLNTPPDLFAEGPDQQRVRLTRLNPQFGPSWGSMQAYNWTDEAGRVWRGGLMVPEGWTPSVPRPLVIQTYGFSPSRFYLDGPNTQDGFTSGFAGRAFLREGLLVLAMPWRGQGDWPQDDHGAIRAAMAGVRGAVEALVREGTVDPDRVGLMGWSATGELVLNQITFSSLPIKSASIMDGDSNTLFSMTITYAASDSIQARKERVNQGPPFGSGRPRWLQNDPSLHTDCVRAALRIETYGPWVLNNWDIYALLRRQYKPVEMVVIPEGTHGLLRPSERMASLQGNVDWHRFWLTGERRTAPWRPGESLSSLQGQYERWEQMRGLQPAEAGKPACFAQTGMR